jgi:lipopolysaccharide export system protein LptA
MQYFLPPLLALFLAMAAIAFAAEPPLGGKEPVDITADSLEVLQKEQIAIFSGHVEAVQGTVTLRADTMRVHYRGEGGGATAPDTATPGGMGRMSKIEVIGNVLMRTPEETVKGDRGLYDVPRQLVTVEGSVLLTRGKNVIGGSRLDYDMSSGKSRMQGSQAVIAPDGTQTGGRVRGVFVPEDKKEPSP